MHAEGQTELGGSERAKPENEPAAENKERPSRVDELAERLKAANADPTVLSIVLENWQRTIGTLAIVFLGFWLYSEYRAKQDEQVGELSRRFDEARRSLVALTVEKSTDAANAAETDDEAKKAELEAQQQKNTQAAIKGADDTFDLLQTTGTGTGYATFAEIYRSLAAAYQQSPAEALQRLKGFKPERYYGATEPTPSQPAAGPNVTAEAAALLGARLQADIDPELARKQLSGLALSGQFVNSEALLSLFRLSENAEQKKAAEAIARRVVIARPEQLDVIQSDLAPFGFKTES